MAIDWVQEDTAATCGAISACSGQTVPGSATTDHSMAEGATAGNTEVLLDIPAGTNDIRAFFQSDQVGELTWEAGTWTVDINISTAANNLFITGVWICRVDDTCTSVATVASDTTFNRDISAAGTQTFSLSGVATDDTDGGAETDSAYVILRVQNDHSMTSRTLGITPNETISAPIESTVTRTLAASAVDSETTLATAARNRTLVSAASDADSATATGAITSPEAFFDIHDISTNSPIAEGATLTVDGTVTNTGDASDTQTIELHILEP